MVAFGMLAAVVLHVMELDGRLDRALRRAYYSVATPASADPACLIVAFDRATVERWGPPPWAESHVSKVLAQASAAGARAIAIVEPEARLMRSAGALSSVALRLSTREDASLRLLPGAPFERILLRDDRGRKTLAGELIRRVAPSLGQQDSAFVHYSPAGSVLPSVAAYRVESGEIPGSLLRDRVLLLGITDPMFAQRITTPVGFLSPAEVHASAIASALSSSVHERVPAWVRWLFVVLVVALHAWYFARRSQRAAVGGTALFLSVAVVVDGVLFNAFQVTLGASLLGFGLVSSCAVFLFDERRLARATVQASLRALAPFRPGQTGGRAEHEALFWDRLGSLHAPYFDPKSSALFALSESGQHLELRWSRRMGNDDVKERRRDVGRRPYNKALSSQRAIWVPQFMCEDGVETLLVPLVSFSRALGFWVLNFDSATKLDAAGLGLVEYLAREASAILERHHIDEDRRGPSLRGGSGLRRSVEAMKDAADRVSGAHAGYQQLLGVMPVGLLVASVTGEVIYSNPAMAQALADAGLPAAGQRWLTDILGRLSRGPLEDVRAQLRDLITEPQSIALHAVSDSGEAIPYAFGLFRLGHGALVGVGAENQGLWPGTFVLTAHPTSEDVEHDGPGTRSSRPPGPREARGKGVGVDPRQLLLRIARQLRARYEECDRPLALELSDPAPLLPAASGRSLRLALTAVLYDVLRHGAGSAPCRVLVEQHEVETVLRVMDPVHAVPQAALFALTAKSAGAEAPGAMLSLKQAKALLQSLGADLEIESRIGSGATFTVRLPARSRESIPAGA